MEENGEKIAIPHLLKFITDCFLAAGVPKNHADIMARSVRDADLMGHHSHGLYKLEKYVLDAYSGIIDVTSTPKINKETAASAWVDGRNGLGPVVANFCMKLAIQKAKHVGAAIVVAKQSNNYGVASQYTKLALKEGLIGWTCTNASAYLVPTRAKHSGSGTNPMSIAAPGVLGDFFLFDMATTVFSGGNIEISGDLQEELPVGVAVNAAGLPETDAVVASQTYRFLPLGSEESRGSYKGYGLSVMIDILCGILGGAFYGPSAGIWRSKFTKKKANIGHCFIVIDPKRFASGFEMRLSEFMTEMRNVTPADPLKPVRIAGDGSRDKMRNAQESGYLWFPKFVIHSAKNVAEMLGLPCVPLLPKPVILNLTSSEELSFRIEAERELAARAAEEEVEEEEIVVKRIEQLEEMPTFRVIEDSWDWMTEFGEENVDAKFQHQQKPTRPLVIRSVGTLTESVRESLND